LRASNDDEGDGDDVGDGNSDATKKTREGCKGNGDSNVRVAGNKEGEGSKVMVMAMAIRVAGEWSATAKKKLMAMATRVAGKRR
jgi:hypothetical protein